PPTPAPAPAPAANKKKGPQQPERRKLSENEEQVYGVSHHDRLGSGPTFRYEKINKLYSHKSGQQQMRITNLLLELDIPARLIMPTAAVTAQFEVLWGAVTTLVDLRKMSDKVDAEIKLEEAKKAERENIARQEAEARGETVEKKDGEEEGEGGGEAAADREKDVGGGGDDAMDKSAESAQADEQKKDQKAEDAKAQKEQQGEGQDQQKKDGEDPAATIKEGGGEKGQGDAAAATAGEKGDQPKIKEEADENGSSSGAGAGAQHKRSASVLSNTSDRSTKKQKK
ncbi:swr complex subunit, partial [Neurospora sp. IMI 360204]